MNADALALAGAVASALLGLVVLLPAAVVSGAGPTLSAYYAAGPFGLWAVGFLALLGVVVFLAARRDHTDPATVAGIGVVVGLGAFLFGALWALTLDPTVLYSFPSEAAWLATHRWVVPLSGLLVAGIAAALARATLRRAPG